MNRFQISFALMAASACVAPSVDARPFVTGERAVFLGDSITFDGRSLLYLRDFYATRHPTFDIRIFNAGVGGDTAVGCAERFPEDVVARRPTSVAVMFGMNDCGLWLYGQEPGGDVIVERAYVLDMYRKNLTDLHDRIRRECPGTERYYLTPTPYDEWTDNPALKVRSVGYGEALGTAACIVRKRAVEDDARLVDYHTRMREELTRCLRDDPAFTFCPLDRVHPQTEGQYLMALTFLEAQGVDPLVSGVTVDSSLGACLRADKARVSSVRTQSDGGVTFDVLEEALPLPLPADLRACAERFDVFSRLDVESLAVTGLYEGNWTLSVDGVDCLTTNAAAWRLGVNLARCDRTPQFRQALAVHEKLLEAKSFEERLRCIAATRWFLRGDPEKRAIRDDPAKVAELVRTWREKGVSGYYETECVPSYPADYPIRAELERKMAALEQEARQLARPRAHAYRLRFADATPLTALAPRESESVVLSPRIAWKAGLSPFVLGVKDSNGTCIVHEKSVSVRSYALTGLEAGKTYRWTVTDATGATVSSSFSTRLDLPRVVPVRGVGNFRDLGGYSTADGRRVRQSLLFRASGLCADAVPLSDACRDARSEALFQGIADSLEAELKSWGSVPATVSVRPGLPFDAETPVCILTSERSVSSDDVRSRLIALSGGTETLATDASLANRGFDTVGGQSSLVFAGTSGVAYVSRTLRAEEATVLSFKASGDWFWAFAANGCLVRDFLDSGNGTTPDKPVHPVLIRLQKGINRLVFAVRPGSSGWSWHCAALPVADAAAAVDEERIRLSEQAVRFSARAKGFDSGSSRLDPSACAFCRNRLGVTTDLDLRDASASIGRIRSPLGPDVRLAKRPSVAVDALLTEKGCASFAAAFRTLLDTSAFPLVFHGGDDLSRADALAFVASAVLGVQEDGLKSGFGEKAFGELKRAFDRFEGKTLSERVFRYLVSLGFEKRELDAFRAFLVE